jgi:ATP synthase F1 delta subunit
MAKPSSSMIVLALGLGLLCMLSAVPAFTAGLPSASLAGTRGATARQQSVLQRHVDGSYLAPHGPVVTYAKALTDASVQLKEEVSVTQDVIHVLKKFNEKEFKDELFFVQNKPMTTEIDRAHDMVKLLQPFKSTVVPKFIVFLGKKRRLISLTRVFTEYVNTLYHTQSIAPVKVISAQRLAPEQQKHIKDKMKVKTGAKDVKLILEVNGALIGGFILEWGYTNPETLEYPCERLDLSLKNTFKRAALNQGVTMDAE